MKKFYSLLIALLVLVGAKAQTYTWQGANGASWGTSTNWSPTRTSPSSSDVLQFNDGSTKSITGVTTQTVGRIIVTSNTTITLQSAAAATLTIGSVTGTELTIDAGSQLTISTNLNVGLANNSTSSIAGTLTVNSGRTFDSDNMGVVSTVTGTIENSGTVLGTSTRLVFSSGSTYIHAQNGGTVPTAGWNANSNCTLTGLTNTYPNGMTQTFGNVTFSSTLTGDVELNGNLTCAGDLTISNSGAAGNDLRGTNSNTDRTITVGGKFSLVSGLFSIDHDNGGSVLNVAGDFEISGGTLTEDGSGSAAVNFNGTSQQNYTKTGGTISGTLNFTINGGAIVNFGTSVLNGSSGTFTLSSTGKIMTANAGGIPSTILVTGTKSYNSGADYEFSGASTGVFTTTTNPQVRNMTINNTGGNVTLAQPMQVNGTLTLTAGALTTSATNLLTIANNATATGASNSSFVDGPLAKAGNDAFTFPVGKVGAGIRTFGMTAPSSTTAVFVAEFFRADPHTLASSFGTGISQISGCEYWTLNRTSSTNSVSLILSWESGSSCSGANYVGNLVTLKVARRNGTSWADEGRLSTTGTLTSGTIRTAAAVTNYNTQFTLATSAADNPLPVMFADVKAFQKNSGVQIEWSNLTERDLVNYTVERSSNGQVFSEINHQSPRSNNNDKESYTAYDATPFQGANFYRIKVQEISGKIIYSKILKVEIGGKGAGFTLYPNPVSGGQVSVSLIGKQGLYVVKVINSAGQEVYSQRLNHQGGSMTQTVVLPSAVKAGVYSMLISGDDYRESKMFVVQ